MREKPNLNAARARQLQTADSSRSPPTALKNASGESPPLVSATTPREIALPQTVPANLLKHSHALERWDCFRHLKSPQTALGPSGRTHKFRPVHYFVLPRTRASLARLHILKIDCRSSPSGNLLDRSQNPRD